MVSMTFAVAFADIGVTGNKTDGVEGEVALTSFNTVTGAQIRLDNPVGIRFTTEISTEDLNKLPDNAVFGTLVIGTDYLGASELTLDTAGVENVVAERWFGVEGGINSYTAVIIGESMEENFPEEYYAMELTARGYVKYTDVNSTEYIAYSDNIVSRSMSYIAAAALASDDYTSDNLAFLQNVADKALGETISFAEDGVTVPTGFDYVLNLTGTNGMPAKLSVTEGEGGTVSGTVFSADVAGSYEVTAVCGSKTCSTVINVKDPEGSLVTDIKSVQVLTKADIAGEVDITVPEIGTANITALYGGTYSVKDENTLSVNLEDKLSVGERDLFIVNDGNIYSLSICVADEIITDGTQFIQMLTERIVDTQPQTLKYYALTADIEIERDLEEKATQAWMYFDTFDGRGHMISNSLEDTPINAYGIFANLYGTVKNLIVNQVRLRTAGNYGGVIAFQVSSGVVENCVVMNVSVYANKLYSDCGYGLLVGRIYGSARITNCLVIDSASLNGERPMRTGYNYYADYNDDGTINLSNYTEEITAILGKKGGSANIANVTGTYCLTKSDFKAAVEVKDGADLLPEAIVSGFEELKTKVNLSDYTLLEESADGVITCGGITVYTPQA